MAELESATKIDSLLSMEPTAKKFPNGEIAAQRQSMPLGIVSPGSAEFIFGVRTIYTLIMSELLDAERTKKSEVGRTKPVTDLALTLETSWLSGSLPGHLF